MKDKVINEIIEIIDSELFEYQSDLLDKQQVESSDLLSKIRGHLSNTLSEYKFNYKR